MRNVHYVQYTNAAGYPPLLNGVRLLANQGWHVEVMGAEVDDAEGLRFPEDLPARVQAMPRARTGWGRRVHFARFTGWVVGSSVRRRPQWVYASDPLSAPAALLLKRLGLARVVYHEHDAPPTHGESSPWMRRVLAARAELARRADLCVLPQAERAEAFVAATGRKGPTLTVWNCPSLNEAAASARPPGPPFVLYYHGSLNEQRLPFTLLHALARLPETVRLRVAGYETAGSRGFIERFLVEARACGVAERVKVLGTLPDREDLWRAISDAHIGLALMPMASDDPNMRWMAGASNKPFDYLSQGLAVLVSDLPDWRSLYVEPGYGHACDPRDPESIAVALRQLLASPERLRAMGEAGRRRILSDWNYERQFEPVLAALNREREE
ncbi:MAG TPA: glycosyltransferase [Rubricoccaceae bacterium]|nr:glycosyltransferase [Rubricoccaceae bacterium]